MDVISNHFDLTDEQEVAFGRLKDLYEDWNSKINVISRKDLDNFYERHVLHSLGIAKVISFNPGSNILDVGTGGGFPGIPLAILFPETNFKLIDSIGKKIMVVEEVANELGLKNVQAEQKRAEKEKGKYDFVVSRAVTRMNKFIPWVRQNIASESKHDLENGILYLKGGDLTEELGEIDREYAHYNLSDFFKDEFFDTKKVVHVPMTYKSKFRKQK